MTLDVETVDTRKENSVIVINTEIISPGGQIISVGGQWRRVIALYCIYK